MRRRFLNEAEEDFEASGYELGDRIVVFGFSRGAALARKFVSEILADDERREVSFLGVYDTVAAMNGIHRRGQAISSDVLFENGTVNERVRRAVHLVALDEERVAFTPTLINRDPAGGSRILEVWMPGIHSDVGGSYWMDGLADLSLSLMIGECRKALAGDIEILDGIDDIKKLLAAKTSRLADVTADDVVIRGLARGVLHENSGLDAMLGGRELRAVCVVENDRPVSVREDAPEDLPLVHSAVRGGSWRSPGNRPAALRGLRYRLLDEDERKSAVLEGIADSAMPRKPGGRPGTGGRNNEGHSPNGVSRETAVGPSDRGPSGAGGLRTHLVALGTGRRGVDERPDAAPVGDREHDLLDAHRLAGAERLRQRYLGQRHLPPVGAADRNQF